MDKNSKVALFEQNEVRKVWNNDQWYFSVTDVVQILTDSTNAKQYIKKMRTRDESLSVNWGTICTPLETISKDGKRRLETMARLEGIFRIIQAIPSPKAEPLKLWLAKVGSERVAEIKDPELAMNRAKELYKRKGYPRSWIDKRLRGINVRNTLTDEWKNRGVRASNEFAILTDEIYKGTFEMTAKEYKQFKDLDRDNNLRDHMGDMELILTMLGEATTTELTQTRNSKDLPELSADASEGGGVAGRTRKDIEQRTGKKVVSKKNMLGGKKDALDELSEEIQGALSASKAVQRPLDVSPKAHHYD